MAEYSRKEFAALCGTTYGIVTMNITRGNLIVEGKKIDMDNPLNKAFFIKYNKKRESKIVTKRKKPVQEIYDQVVEKVPVKSKTRTVKQTEKERSRKKGEELVDWDMRKKRAEALLKERNAEKALLSVKKMYGEMLPTDFVKRMFSTFSKTVFSVFDNSMMNLAGVYCDELAGGDREALSRVNQKLNEEFQIIIDSASDIAMKDLENEIKEYSVKRGKGEKIS